MLSEISQLEGQKSNPTYMWNLKNSYVCAKQTHRYRKQTCDYQKIEGGREGNIKCMGLTDTNYYI